VYILRYEDFAINPNAQIHNIQDFLGLSYVEPSERVSNFNERYFEKWEELGKNRNYIQYTIRENGNIMEQFGYMLSYPYVQGKESLRL